MRVYLDNAATTALSPKVLEKMMPYMTELFGNPSSIHSFGRDAKNGVDRAREQVAKALNAKPEEIVFTAGGTESDNTVLFGVLERYKNKGNHIITTAAEHHAVLHTLEQFEKSGLATVTYLPVDEYGRIRAEQVKDAITEKTVLVTVMYANNEVGTIQPIAEIGKVCREKGVLFHSDAVQAVGHVPVDVQALNLDFLSLSAHKFHGPKGVGALYIRKGLKIPSLLTGGAQERNRRAGTENTPGIVGLGEAIGLAVANMDETSKRMIYLRDKLIREIPMRITEVKLNGHPTERVPNNVNFSIRYIEGESILLLLDLNDIAASSGSACTSGSLDPSHVLLAMGLPHEIAHGSLRLSLGDDTTEEEIDYVLETLPKVVEKLRAMSPLYTVPPTKF